MLLYGAIYSGGTFTGSKSLLQKDSFNFRGNGYGFFEFWVIADHDRFCLSKNFPVAVMHLVAEIEAGVSDLINRDNDL